MRKNSRETCISRESVSRIAKQELQLKPYKLKRVQILTPDNKRVRLKRCLRLLRRVAPLNWEQIPFTDEKLFTIEQPKSTERQELVRRGCRYTSTIVEHRQDPKSVMVWAGICVTDKTPLGLVDEWVKIEKCVCRRDILDFVVVPYARRHFGRQQ